MLPWFLVEGQQFYVLTFVTDWSDFDGKCILYSKPGYTKVEADAYCESVGGKLYEPVDRTQEAAVREWVLQQGLGDGLTSGPWLGIKRIESGR